MFVVSFKFHFSFNNDGDIIWTSFFYTSIISLRPFKRHVYFIYIRLRAGLRWRLLKSFNHTLPNTLTILLSVIHEPNCVYCIEQKFYSLFITDYAILVKRDLNMLNK